MFIQFASNQFVRNYQYLYKKKALRFSRAKKVGKKWLDKQARRILKCLKSCDSKTDVELKQLCGDVGSNLDFLVRDHYIIVSDTDKIPNGNGWMCDIVHHYKIDGYGKSYLADRKSRAINDWTTRIMSAIALLISLLTFLYTTGKL